MSLIRKRLLILGCGWVGEAFAFYCRDQGIEVWASTTNRDKCRRLQNDGISSFIQDFDLEESVEGAVPTYFDFVLTSVPATKKNTIELLTKRFQQVHKFLDHLTYGNHIFLSSVGIYPDLDQVFDESYGDVMQLDPKLLLAEDIMRTLPHTHVFRLGGLFGKNRIFAKYFENKVCSTGYQLANFVHIEDVVRLLFLDFAQPAAYDLFNVVAPEHPLKKDVIIASGVKYGFAPPLDFDPQEPQLKLVSSKRIARVFDYTFLYPSPLYF